MPTPNTPTGSVLARLNKLASHPNNLSYQLFRECVFWNTSYKEGNLDKRLGGANRVPKPLVAAVKRFTEEAGRIPRILDLGCGPLPTSTHLVTTGKAEVVAVDLLANSYTKLFQRWGETPIAKLNEGSGENFLERYGQFDIAFISNALDHTQCPPLTWLNLYKATKVGGYMVHVHGIREATHHSGEQLHRFDLYPEEHHLGFATLSGESMNLSEGLAVKPLGGKVVDVGKEDHPWFHQTFRKESDALPSSDLLNFVLSQLQNEFLATQSWRGRLEGFVNELAGYERLGLPYSSSHHRALVALSDVEDRPANFAGAKGGKGNKGPKGKGQRGQKGQRGPGQSGQGQKGPNAGTKNAPEGALAETAQ